MELQEYIRFLGLREGTEEDHTTANLVNTKRSSQKFVLNNQNMHRVVINKIEILVHKYI